MCAIQRRLMSRDECNYYCSVTFAAVDEATRGFARSQFTKLLKELGGNVTTATSRQVLHLNFDLMEI